MFLKKSKILNIFLILTGFFLTGLFCYGHLIDGDVVQILNKAHILVTQNVITPYGNLSSSGVSGVVPGSFLTLVSGLPMKLWFSPWAALFFLTFLHFLAFLMFQSVFKNFISPLGITVLIVFFWLNPWRLSEVFLWNPGYIFFVSVIHMWSAYQMSCRSRFLPNLIHGLSLFIGLQVHPSFVILFFMTLMLLWMKAIKLHWKGIFSSFFLGLMSLIPFFLAGIENPDLFIKPGGGDNQGFLFFGLVAVYPILKAFWYWILFGSGIFQKHIFHQLNFSWINSDHLELVFKSLWLVIKYAFGCFGLFLSFYMNYRFFKNNREKFNILKYKMKKNTEWIKIYGITAFFSALVATAVSPTLPIYWHLLYVWPMALIPVLLGFEVFLKNGKWNQRTKNYLVLVTVYFVMTDFFGAMGSKKHDINQNLHELYFKACKVHCNMKNLSGK